MPSPYRDDVTEVVSDGSGSVWATTGRALARLDATGGALQVWWADAFLPESFIWGLVLDRHGRLWFGLPNNDTPAGGIVMLAPDGTWQRFTTADGLATDDVWAIAVDEEQDEIVAIGNGGLSIRAADGGWRAMAIPDGLDGGSWVDAMVDHAGNRWFGSDDSGLWRRGGDGTWEHVQTVAGAPLQKVWALGRGPDGTLLVAPVGGGLLHLDAGGSWRRHAPPAGAAAGGPWVGAIAVGRDGAVWLATSDGAVRVR